MTKPRARKQLEARERARLRRQAKDALADREADPERAAPGTFDSPAAVADAGQTAGPQGAGGERPVEPVLVQLVNNEGDRATELQCPWCATVFPVKPRGRVPTWCSPACRQRAWEQARAAASGRSAITVVERVVNTPVFHPAWCTCSGPHATSPDGPPRSGPTNSTNWPGSLTRAGSMTGTSTPSPPHSAPSWPPTTAEAPNQWRQPVLPV